MVVEFLYFNGPERQAHLFGVIVVVMIIRERYFIPEVRWHIFVQSCSEMRF